MISKLVFPIHKRDTGGNEPTTAEFLCLFPQEECMPRCRENQSWMMPSAFFVAAVAVQKKFLLASKLARNLGSMPKTDTHVSSTSGKYVAVFLVKSFGGCCGSTVLTGAYCRPSRHRIPVWKIVSLSTESTHNRSALVLDSDNGVCCHTTPLRSLYQGSPNYCPRAKSDLRSHSPGRKTHFANNEKIIYLRKMGSFGRI